jgi:uncharacterized membrane protein
MTYWSVMYGGMFFWVLAMMIAYVAGDPDKLLVMLWFTALAIFSLHVAASEFKPKRRDKPTSQPTEPALPGEG